MLNQIEAISGACASCAARNEDDQPATLGRRQFLSASLMAAAAAALAACSATGMTDATSPSSVGLSVKVSDYATLANVGGVALINASGSPIAVVRTGTSTFVALSRVCPHQGSTVNAVTGGFLCPNHEAVFNAAGRNTGGQQTSSLTEFTVTANASATTLTIVG